MTQYLIALLPIFIAGAIVQRLKLNTIEKMLRKERPDILALIGDSEKDSSFTHGMRFMYVLPMECVRNRLPTPIRRDLAWIAAFNALSFAYGITLATLLVLGRS